MFRVEDAAAIHRQHAECLRGRDRKRNHLGPQLHVGFIVGLFSFATVVVGVLALVGRHLPKLCHPLARCLDALG